MSDSLCFCSCILSGPPTFTAPLASQVVAPAGRQYRLACNVSAQPLPTVAWTVPPGSTARTVGIYLVIDSVQESDTGMYMCTASNYLGSVSATTTLEVQGTCTWRLRPLYCYKYFEYHFPTFSPISKLITYMYIGRQRAFPTLEMWITLYCGIWKKNFPLSEYCTVLYSLQMCCL